MITLIGILLINQNMAIFWTSLGFVLLSEGTDYCTLSSQDASVELKMLTTRYQIEKYSSIFKFLAELSQTMNTNIKSTFLFKYRNENICLNLEVGSMMHNCNSSTQEAEARRLVVLGEPNPHSETLNE